MQKKIHIISENVTLKGKQKHELSHASKKWNQLYCELCSCFATSAVDIIGLGLAAALNNDCVSLQIGRHCVFQPRRLVMGLFCVYCFSCMFVCFFLVCFFLPVFNKSAIELFICRLLSSVNDGARGRRVLNGVKAFSARTGIFFKAFALDNLSVFNERRGGRITLTTARQRFEMGNRKDIVVVLISLERNLNIFHRLP